MWSINSEEIHLAKEELKGRRAAIEARYVSELKSVDTDATEIETLERVAAAFATKHQVETKHPVETKHQVEEIAPPPPPAEEPPAAEMVPPAAAVMLAAVATALSDPPTPAETRSTSRWRLRLGDSQGERD